MTIIDNYENALLAALGALTANKVVTSKESHKVIRDASKHIESLGVELRKYTIEQDKRLVINDN